MVRMGLRNEITRNTGFFFKKKNYLGGASFIRHGSRRINYYRVYKEEIFAFCDVIDSFGIVFIRVDPLFVGRMTDEH
jgi:hypothetical protein